jgi:hypothetical protein
MRSVNRLALASLLLALAPGCGDWSNEDLRFLAALPTRADLHVEVPAGPGPAAGACPDGESSVWLEGKPASDRLNAGVEWILGLVDEVRRHDPTRRTEGRREWGPFDDGRHPGKEIVIVMQRGEDEGGRVVHEYVFAAREKGIGLWTPLVVGGFTGGSARAGSGLVHVDFDAIRALGMNDDPGAPRGELRILYDRASVPRAIALELDQDGFGLERFDYVFFGYDAGAGRFVYAFRNGTGDRLVVDAGFDGAGQGRAAVTFTAAGGATGGFQQCWTGGACLVYVNDPNDFSCGAPPCSLGSVDGCPAVPASPF